MILVGDTVRKTGASSLLAVEAEKASRAFEIGRDSGLFSVPKVVDFDAKAGVLEFERLGDLVTLLDLMVRKDQRLPGLLKKAGRALAVVHKTLVLPEEMRHDLPPEWMAPIGENVFIHGDFTCVNVCFHEPSDELVLLDWSAAPMVGRIPTLGSRYFDMLLFVSSIFHGAPWRRAFNWNAKEMADIFLRGYGEAIPEFKLDEFKSYSSHVCRLQRRNIRQLAARRRLLRAAGFICHQMLMNARLRLFLHR
jgi:tRNA A-37 threonylcarbamoyl transferase component Bud32